MPKTLPTFDPPKGAARSPVKSIGNSTTSCSTARGTATRIRSTRLEKKRDPPVVPPKVRWNRCRRSWAEARILRPSVSRMKLLVAVIVVLDVLLDPVAPDVAARETGLAVGFVAATR